MYFFYIFEFLNNNDRIKNRISVSAVIEINEQGSEEATWISNSLLAMMNSQQGVFGKTGFDTLTLKPLNILYTAHRVL